LSYLRCFPFDKIKIDRSFVSELSERPDCVAIIRAVAGLGQSLGIATTAEGIETPEQLERGARRGMHRGAGLSVQSAAAAGRTRRSHSRRPAERRGCRMTYRSLAAATTER